MAAIDQYLRQILEATYGEEVRHSIHDAIKQNYMDVSDSVAQANQAADAAEEALAKANQATANVNAVVDRANTASSTANAASSTANSASERATSAATRVETIERKYTNATAQASSLAPGATPTATLEDGSNGKIFKFGIPKGEKGNTGATPQLSIGTVTKGANAAASMTGTAEAPVLNLTLPKGDTGTTPQLSIGNVAKGENAGATITGTAEAPVLNLTLPKGDTGGKGDKGDKGNTGTTPQLSIGTVTKSATAGATITGTAENPVLNLNLPKGDTGATPQLGVGTVETGLPGSQVEVTISGTAEAPNLNFKIPKGDTGVAENIYGNTVQMSEQDSTTVAAAIGAKANASETYTKTQVDAMIAGATDADAVHSVNGETATNHAVTVNADKIKMSASEDVTIPNKLKQYVKTVNGTAPDPITGNVTVATGGGDSTVGLIRRIIGIPVSEWAGSGPYTYTYPDDDIKVGMVVLEEYLSDEYAQLGVNTYTIQNGSLTIATTVKPTADWSLTVVLGMDGSSILDDVGSLQTKVGTSPLTTTAQNLSDAVNELDDEKADKDNLSTGVVTCATLNDIKTAFIEKVNTMPDDSVSFIVLNITGNVTEFAGGGRWICRVNKRSNSYQTFSCEYNSGYNANRIYPVYVKNENGTWYFYSLTQQIGDLGPYNGLDSTSTTAALSAAQGKALDNTKVSKTDLIPYKNINWISSVVLQLKPRHVYLFVSYRYNDFGIIISYTDGVTGYKPLIGTNWTGVSQGDSVIVMNATNQADYIVLDLFI